MATSTSIHSLGTRCLALDRAVIAVGDQTLALPRPLGPVPQPYGPAVGVRCAPSTTAIAYPIKAWLLQGSPEERHLAVVVPRLGSAEIVDPNRDEPLLITDEFGPVVDVGRRALGMATPPEATPPVVMLDAIWIDRVLTHILETDLGSSPPWAALAPLHPLACGILSPSMLRDRRAALSLDWTAFRQRATGVDTAWPKLAPELAAWLDDGSFARWVLAELPSTFALLDDLAELVDPQVMIDIDEALVGAPLW